MEARLICMALVCLCIAQVAFANDIEQRYIKFLKQVRCSVCQNQSLFESNSAAAATMREKIYAMFKSNMSEAQISAQLRSQYGDAILFMPPVRTDTLALWIGPLTMLAIAIAATRTWLRGNRPLQRKFA